MPSGYKLDTSGERDTGISTAPDSTQQVPASTACTDLEATSWINATGIIAGSFAENDYYNSDQTEEIAQEADAYTSTADAERAMTKLWQILGTCAQFTDSSGGTTATITVIRSAPSGIGDQAFDAVQISPAFDGGSTLVAVRVGYVIVTCMDSSSGSDNGSAALSYAQRIVQNIDKRM